MWKDFFYFNKTERIGTIVLVVLILLFATYRFVIAPYCHKDNRQLTTSEIRAFEKIQAQMKTLQQYPPKGKVNPILLDSTGFRKIGFSETETHQIMNKKRVSENEEFYLFFCVFAIEKDPEWSNHIAEFKY